MKPIIHKCFVHMGTMGRCLKTSLAHPSSIAPVIRCQLPWNSPFTYPLHNALTIPEQMTPVSSLCQQLCSPQSREGHFHRWDSFPVQLTPSSQICPVPSPKRAEALALRASPQPSCLHTTWASFRSHLPSQMVPLDP